MKAENFEYPADKLSMYRILKTQLQGLTDGVPHLTANLANASALLNQALGNINWVGFYLLDGDTLILGPFQGKPACVEIKTGSGVCGTAVAKDEVMLVKNVHEFPGHIACDSASNSEIVVPIHFPDGTLMGVLDIDSPILERFDDNDRQGLTEFVKTLERVLGDG